MIAALPCPHCEQEELTHDNTRCPKGRYIRPTRRGISVSNSFAENEIAILDKILKGLFSSKQKEYHVLLNSDFGRRLMGKVHRMKEAVLRQKEAKKKANESGTEKHSEVLDRQSNGSAGPAIDSEVHREQEYPS